MCVPHRRFGRAPLLVAWLLAGLGAAVAGPASAQSVLEHPPDLGGTWVGARGTVYFDLIHRFKIVGGSAHKVVNSPTFLLATPLTRTLMVGVQYATNSLLVSDRPNEWALFGRLRLLKQGAGRPVDVALTGGYNGTARSWDGEMELARELGPLRVLGVGRAFTAFGGHGARVAAGGGLTLRLTRSVALAADAVTLLDRHAGEDVVWGGGLQLRIPYSPHTLSLQVSNANTETLQGASVGVPRGLRWGFEFTIPITLGRYFGAGPVREGPASTAGAAGIAADVAMTERLRFVPDTIRIRAGQAVRWTNGSNIVHTVTDDPRLARHAGDGRLPPGAAPFSSGNVQPGASYVHRFRVPGVYHYFCIPHELDGMVAVIVVER